MMHNIKRIFKEFDKHLILDKKPSDYFNKIIRSPEISDMYPFSLLNELVYTPQSPEHHPEGSVWNHTMMVVDHAAERKSKSEHPRILMWAALLHDLGKPPTTKLKKGRYTSYDHDKVGEELSIGFLKECTSDEDFIYKVSKLIRWHMQTLFVVKNLPFADIETMLKETSIDEVALLSLCDRLGRGGMTKEKIEQEKENVRMFLEKSKSFHYVLN